MSVSYIPEPTRRILWGKAAGCCQYRGCTKKLWRDDLTKAEFNTSYIAHIIADKPGGPRGDEELSEKLKQELSNLMLMCDEHHRLIDKKDVDGHPVSLLQKMKQDQEARIDLLSSLSEECSSEILFYGDNIGVHGMPLNFKACAQAMVPDYYPASSTAIELGMNNSVIRDSDENFWNVQEENLRRQFNEKVKPGLDSGKYSHLSVFSLAPQPLLCLLGNLIGDVRICRVYQKRREPDTWKWDDANTETDFSLTEPKDCKEKLALVLSLSATVSDDRVYASIGKDVSIWRIDIDDPNNDFMKSESQLRAFRQVGRKALNRIKAKHGEDKIINVFPAVPNSIAIELGRILMPKADLPLRFYDQVSERGGFVPALVVGDMGRLAQV